MNCEIKKKYTPNEFERVAVRAKKLLRSLNGEQELQNWLDRNYTAEDAEALYEAIITKKFNRSFGEDVQSSNESLIKNDASSVEGERTSDEEPSDNFYVTTEEELPASFFVRHTNDDEYKKLVKEFNERIIKDLVYNSETGIGVGDPNSLTPIGVTIVNDRLRSYRDELISKLENVVGKVKVANDKDPIQYRTKINLLLHKFKKAYQLDKILNDGKEGKISKDAYRAYVTLATFDKLITDLNIVKLNSGYSDSDMYIDGNRYVYVGQKIKYDQRFGQETADIDDYTSPLVKILLNIIQGADKNNNPTGSPVTLAGFKRAIHELMGWCWVNTATVTITDNIKINPYEEILKGEKADWNNLILLYLASNFSGNTPLSKIGTILNGIRYHIFNKMPLDLRNLFINQISNTVHSSYLEYITAWNKDHAEVKTVLAEDRLLDRSEIVLKKRIAYKVNFYQQYPDVFRQRLADLNIKVDDANNQIQIKVPLGNNKFFTLSITRDGDDFTFSRDDKSYNFDTIPDETIANIIEQLLDTYVPREIDENGVTRYNYVINDINEKLPKNLLGVFGKAIAITCLASDPSTSDQFVFDGNGEENKLLKFNTQLLNNSVYEAAKFVNDIYEYGMASVVKNLNGDNLPAGQLGSMFFRTHNIIQDIRNTVGNHALSDSLFVLGQNRTAIVNTNIREGIKINGEVKSIESLNPAEVVQVAIIQDFWNRINNNNPTDKLSHVVDVQPMTYSDKKRQMTKSIVLERLNLGFWGSDTNAFNYIRQIATTFVYNPDGTKAYNEDDRYNIIRKVRSGQVRYSAIDILNRFSKAFKAFKEIQKNAVLKSLEEQQRYSTDLERIKKLKERYETLQKEINELSELSLKETTYNNIVSRWDLINEELAKRNSKEAIAALMRNVNADFLDETDIVKVNNDGVGAGFALNPMLQHNIELYLSDNSDGFIQRMRRQKQLFIRDLIDSDFVLSVFKDGSLWSTFNKYAEERPQWVDKVSGTILLYKVRDSKGKELNVDIHDSTIDFTTGEYNIELNPILNSYFFTQNLLGQQIKALHFGETWNYKGKSDIDLSHYDFEEDESARFIAQTKRAVIGGGTVKLFIKGRAYGIADNWRMASWQDVEASVQDLAGDEHNEKVADGAVYMAKEQAIMENWSLQDSSVGENFKKSLYGEIDRSGSLNEIKTAAFTISNYNRKHNPFSTSINMERMFKLTHSDTFDNIINFVKYYNPEEGGTVYKSSKPGESSRKITETDYVYFWDQESGKYFRINKLIQNGNKVARVLQEVAIRNGNVVETGKEFTEGEKTINSFYAIDQMFGGAWCLEYDPKSKSFKTSEKNGYISAIIMCEENLKDKIIHYVVSTSAFKVGMKNVNASDVFSLNSTVDKLWEFSFDPAYSGVQMDAKHDVENGHVTEMSQMVQSLIQDGYLVEMVEEIYKEIANVTKSGRSDFESTDKENIVKAISKALIKSLQSNNSNIVTLADTFVKQVASDYERYRTEQGLPFSVASLRGKFIAVVTAALSKNSLRRSYPGLGTVQAPGYGFMQYFDLPIKRAIGSYHLTYKEAVDQLRDLAHSKGKLIDDCFVDKNAEQGTVTDDYINTWENTTVLTAITPKEIDFEDTIIFREGNKWVVKKIASGTERDYYKNLYNWSGIIYRWNTQGRDLLPSITRVRVNDDYYNLWDFDSERACFYINELIKANKDKSEGKPVNILGYQEKIDFIKMLHPDVNVNSNTSLKQLLKIEKANARQIFVEYSEALKEGNIFKTSQFAFDSQETRNTLRRLLAASNVLEEIKEILNNRPSVDQLYAIAKYARLQDEETQALIYSIDPNLKTIDTYYELGQPEVSFAQVIMGRIHGSKFNLPSGTNVAEILSQGENYFIKSINNLISHPKSRTTRQLYDIALHSSNGDSLYVLVGNNELNNARWRNVDQVSKKFKALDGDLYYNGDVLCESYGIQFGTFVDESGIERNMLYVKDADVLNKIRYAGDFDFERYNYQDSNWRNVIQQQYAFVFENGKLVKDLYLNNIKLKKGSHINNINLPDIVQTLRNLESEKTSENVFKLAKKKFDAFKKSLLYIGARIPSQSMQSYSGAEIINFTDSSENEIYLPRTLTWVAGSDFDIDKWYIMGWSITDTGTIPSFKSLPGFTDDDVQRLPAPNGKVFDYNISEWLVDGENVINITEDELLKFASGDINPIRKVLLSDATTINFVISDELTNDTDGLLTIAEKLNKSLDYAQEFIDTVNKWNKRTKRDKNIIKSYADAVFKNNVVRTLQEALKDPSVQINLLTSLNMDVAKNAAKSNVAASNRDKTMSADNPMAIFNQQYANMVGRSGISGVAVAQKAFNTMSFALNLGVTQWSRKLRESKALANDLHDLIDYLSVITFKGKLDENSPIRTLANLNLRPLIKTLKDLNITTFNYGEGINPLLEEFIDEAGQFKLAEYVQTLQNNSNINNATDLFSNLMSAATDNAKELLLDKLNAIGDFIDVYCYLFATGESFEDIGKFTTSSIFNTVLRYSRGNIFEIGNSRPGFRNAIDFVRDQKDLNVANPNLYKASLSNREFLRIILASNETVLQEIIDENDIRFANGAANISRKIGKDDLRRILFDPASTVPHIAYDKENFCYTSKFNDILAEKVKSLFKRDVAYALSYLRWLGPIAESAPTHQTTYVMQDNDYGYDDNYDELLIAEENSAKYNVKYDTNIHDVTQMPLIALYRYVQEYVIPKNHRLKMATDLGENIEDILDKLVAIHDGAAEMSILGQVLAINQGMKANDYNEYNFIAKFNSSINRRYITKFEEDKKTNSDLENDYVAFDFLRFIRDADYRESQIKQYDKVKNTFNVLDVIAKSPHFMEMYDTATLNREIITDNSAAARLTRTLATRIFDIIYNEDGSDKVNRGLLYNLSKQEYSKLSKYVDDLITYHFLINTGEILSFENLDKLKNPFKEYVRSNNGDIRLSRKAAVAFDLTDPMGIASFKKLMDTVIIPGLKSHDKFKSNMFIRMLAMDGTKDPKTGIIKRYYKISTDSAAMNPMSKAYNLYTEARDGFFDIANKPIPEEILPKNDKGQSWSIMDLFYLYNLIVSKEGFTATGFSTIFDDVINQGLKTNLVNTYLKYIAALDKGDIKYKEGGSSSSVIGYSIVDAIASILTPANTYKFRAEVTATGFNFKDADRLGIDGINLTENPYPSDFTFDFPSLFASNFNFVPKWEGYEPQINIQTAYIPSSTAVIKEMVRYMQELFGDDIRIRVINNLDLDKWEQNGSNMFEGDVTDAQKAMIRNSLGFIHDGVIYLNPDVEGFGIHTPIHELSHIICANLKFNPKYKNLYYELLNAVWEDKIKKNQVEDLKRRYPNRKASDLKEEALAEFIADKFATNFDKEFGNKTIFSYELSDAVRETLNTIFRTNFDRDLFDLRRLGETNLENVFRIVNTGLFDFSTHSVTKLNIILSQKLATIKNDIVDYKCIKV